MQIKELALSFQREVTGTALFCRFREERRVSLPRIAVFLARRLIFAAVLMLGVSATIFFLINSIGNPIELMMAETPGITGEVLDKMKAYYGLDHPPIARYFLWLGRLLHLDFGTSIIYNQPFGSMILQWGWQTLKIQVPALVIALALSIVFGITAARRQHSRSDFTVMGVALLGQSLPAFFLGVLLILVFSYTLDWLPSYGAYSTRNPLWGSPLLDAIWHQILPVTMLTFFNTATLTLLMRSNMVDVLKSDFIAAMRASGIPERRVIYVHALRAAFIPMLTYLGLLIGLMLGTAPVTESVFTWPGLGYLSVSSIHQLDYPVIMGASTVIAFMLIATSLITDVIYVLIDPRISLE
jgi:peptide/nickel transport system permease protein